MKTIVTETVIQASAPHIWRVLTDFDDYPNWCALFPDMRGRVADGAELQMTLKLPACRPKTLKAEVLEVISERDFSWLRSAGLVGFWSAEHRFRVRPSTVDSCRFIHMEVYRGLAVPLFWRLQQESMMKGFELFNLQLKRRVESLHPSVKRPSAVPMSHDYFQRA